MVVARFHMEWVQYDGTCRNKASISGADPLLLSELLVSLAWVGGLFDIATAMG